MIRQIDHTADVGIEVEAQSLQDLFEESAYGMFSIICENLDEVECKEYVEGSVQGEDLNELMYNFLENLLFLFETKLILLKDVQVKIHEGKVWTLEFKACGEPVKKGKHRIATGIKSPTYHQMKVGKNDGKYIARIIFDV